MDKDVYVVVSTSIIDCYKRSSTDVRTEHVVGYDNARRHALLQYLEEFEPEDVSYYDVELPETINIDEMWEFFQNNSETLFEGEYINDPRFRVEIERVETTYTTPGDLTAALGAWQEYVEENETEA